MIDEQTAFLKAFVWDTDLSQVLVIIPAYNEEACIGDVVRNVRESGLTNVLVVDDGSADRTAAEARKAGAYAMSLTYNLGIGGAVQAGLKFALEMGYQYVVRLDGDGQHQVEEALKLLRLVQSGDADVAVGSRFFPGQHTYRPPLSRAIGIRWFATLISLITRRPAYDTTSGMQAINRAALTILANNYPQDYPEVEARVLLHKARLTVLEVPVHMRPRAAGMSSITMFGAVYYVFKVSLATLIAAMRQAPRRYAEET